GVDETRNAIVCRRAVASARPIEIDMAKTMIQLNTRSRTMARNRMYKGGFTLVEILIVVIILGILAAIVIPQFTSASQDARKNSLTSQLQTIRSQIELYKLQHLDKLPPVLQAGTGWTDLTNQSKADMSTGATTAFPFGPYLQTAPTNSLNGA